MSVQFSKHSPDFIKNEIFELQSSLEEVEDNIQIIIDSHGQLSGSELYPMLQHVLQTEKRCAFLEKVDFLQLNNEEHSGLINATTFIQESILSQKKQLLEKKLEESPGKTKSLIIRERFNQIDSLYRSNSPTANELIARINGISGTALRAMYALEAMLNFSLKGAK